MRTSPRPTPATIGAYYPDDYGPYTGTQVTDASAKKPVSGLRLLSRRLFQFRATALPDVPPGRMLEIGCASGSYLHEMAEAGWVAEGIEFSPSAAEAARHLGFSVFTGPLEEAPGPQEPADLVAGWMVAEHLHEPLQAFTKLHQWTKPGGYLVISTPDTGCVGRRWFGNAWRALHLPHHLFHYDATSIRVLLDRAGWRVERILYPRLLNNWIVSMGHWLQDRGRVPGLSRRMVRYAECGGLLHYLLYPVALVLAAFGQTGDMIVWARRLDD